MGADWDFRRLHHDVTAGVKTIIGSGLIDGARVATLGQEFGAFLALCGATYEADLYRAAICVAGTYDWIDAAKELSVDSAAIAEYEELVRYLGKPLDDAPTYRAISPLRQAADVKAAFLVGRGHREDGPASTAQSRRLVSVLNSHRKTVDVVVADGIDPGFYGAENRVRLAKAVETFLARHLPSR